MSKQKREPNDVRMIRKAMKRQRKRVRGVVAVYVIVIPLPVKRGKGEK